MNYFPTARIVLTRATRLSPVPPRQTMEPTVVLDVSACIESTKVSDMTKAGTYTKLGCMIRSSALTVDISVLDDLSVRTLHGESFTLEVADRTHNVTLMDLSYAPLTNGSGVYFLNFRILPSGNAPRPSLTDRLRGFLNFGFTSAKGL